MATIRLFAVIAFAAVSLCPLAFAADEGKTATAQHWDAPAAARYLDARAGWWQQWPAAQRDHNTACLSCHTLLPYALSRHLLRSSLRETSLTAQEQTLQQHVERRVSLWSEVEPYYNDAKSGKGKSRESRATESVLNALVMASAHAGGKQVHPLARQAFDNAWALQLPSGAWDWQVFHLAPWESSDSQYHGAAFMALALSWMPHAYLKEPGVQPKFDLLRAYLQREAPGQPLLHRAVLLWASARLPELLTKQEKQAWSEELTHAARQDHGWSLASLGAWSRSDQSSQDVESDGYATAVAALALQGQNSKAAREAKRGALAWLDQHQNAEDGSWRTVSLNKKRDAKSDVGKFMSDAATGYAVLALESVR